MSRLNRLYAAASRFRRIVAPRRTDSLDVASLSRALLGDQRFVAMDVGAAKGLLPHWEDLPHFATVYQIEPREDACKELEAINAAAGYPPQGCRVIAAGLSGTGGEHVLYVSNSPTGSSLYEIHPDLSADCAPYVDLRYLFPMVPVPIQTTSLGGLLDDQAEPRLDLIKLDIQGAELDVLKGLGADRMNGLLGIEAELGLHSLYPSHTRFTAAHGYLQECGFELFDVRVARVHMHRDGDHEYFQTRVFSTYGNAPTISARIWEFDALYLRSRSNVLGSEDPGLLRRMIVVYCTYNFFAEAYDLVESARAKGLFDENTARDLCQAIVDVHHVRHYRPWLSDTRMMRWLRRKAYAIAPRSAPRWCQYMYQNYPNG